MFEWINANAATIIMAFLVLVIVVLAVRHLYKARKSGGCLGCTDSAGCNGFCGLSEQNHSAGNNN